MLNTNLDEICAVIGYTATNALAAWYGGRWLRVPGASVPIRDGRAERGRAALERVIGAPALRRLVGAYSGQQIWVGRGYGVDREARRQSIAERLASGVSVARIAEELGCHRSTIDRIRRELLASEILVAEKTGRQQWGAVVLEVAEGAGGPQ